MISVLPGSMSTATPRPAPGRRRRTASAARWCRSTVPGARRSRETPRDTADTKPRRWSVGSRPICFSSVAAVGGKIGRRQRSPGRPLTGFCAAQDALLHLRRKAARRLAHAAGHQVDDRFGKRQLALRIEHVVGRQIVGDQEQRHVADRLRRGVTLTMSPNSWFTSAYMRQISCQRDARPSACACSNRFVYCPPGISCR